MTRRAKMSQNSDFVGAVSLYRNPRKGVFAQNPSFVDVLCRGREQANFRRPATVDEVGTVGAVAI